MNVWQVAASKRPRDKNGKWLRQTHCWRGHELPEDRQAQGHECQPCRRYYDRPITPQYALWENGGAEYWFLREQGMTPREIGEKHGVRWESFQRTLYRRIGGKTEW